MLASYMDEAISIKSWLDRPFSSTELAAERDALIAQYRNPVKGEFETTAQFEQRKKDASTRIAAITKEYDQKISDARAAHESSIARMRARLRELLASSRETITLQGTLGSYNADTQRYRISIPEKAFDIIVPLDKAPGVKQDIGKYQLQVTRQLNESLGWDYLEARLVGPAGTFASTDKAPTQTQSVSVALIPPDLSATVSFTEPSSNARLDAEETAQVTIIVKNSGKGSGNMVEAAFMLENASGISFANTLYFGEVKAGTSVSKTLNLSAGMDTRDGKATLKINFTEQNGFPPDDKILIFETRALQAPDIYIADIGIQDNSGNNKIEPGEQVEVTVRVHNRGQGIAKSVVAEVKRGDGVYFVGESVASFNLGDMKAGEYRDVKFNIVTNKTAAKPDVRIDLRESRSQFSKLDQPLNLAFNKVERTADQMVVQGTGTNIAIANAPALSIDVEQDIPQRGKENKNRWGVIFGIENYRNVGSVRFALRDAEYMFEYFTKTLGIPAANIYRKHNDAATKSEFNIVFDPGGWLAKNAGKKDSEIFIYFSGHGVPVADGKKAYLLPADGNPNYAENTAYELNTLYANLQSIKAKQITVFLDCCFSGANRDNEIILADARPVFISSPLPSASANMAIFSAATGAQIANSYSDFQHGLFSYYLMKGLRGEADANKDKKITQQELNAYLAENVDEQARRMGREQQPQLMSGDPDRVIVQW
jgi:hypothetical protein